MPELETSYNEDTGETWVFVWFEGVLMDEYELVQ